MRAAGTLERASLKGGGEFLLGEANVAIVATRACRPPEGIVEKVLGSVPEDTAELKRMHVAPDYQRPGYVSECWTISNGAPGTGGTGA